MGVEVVSPVKGIPTEKVLLLTEFEFAKSGKVVQCPHGHAPVKVKEKKNRFTASFELADCQNCPRRGECPVVPGKRHFYLRYDRKAVRLAKRRAYEETLEFRDRYRFRAGIEGTISAYDARTGVKRLRVRGRKAVRFCATLKATGINIFRAAVVRRALRDGAEPLPVEIRFGRSLFLFQRAFGDHSELLLRLFPSDGLLQIFCTYFGILTFYETIIDDAVQKISCFLWAWFYPCTLIP